MIKKTLPERLSACAIIAMTLIAASGCSVSTVNTDEKNRSSSRPTAASLERGDLDILVARSGYQDMGAQMAQRAPGGYQSFSDAVPGVLSNKFKNRPLESSQASAAAISLSLATRLTDITGTAAEIGGVVSTLRTPAQVSWGAVELGYGPESGASGFAITDGQRAILGKAIGSPLIAYLPASERSEWMQPHVRLYHPVSGNSHMIASWPWAGHPVAGMNKRGLAMTVTSFAAGSPAVHTQMPFTYRRILQNSSTVAQAIRRLYNAPQLDTGAVVHLADRTGAIAQVQCSIERCVEVSVLRGQPGTLAHGADNSVNVGGPFVPQQSAGSAQRVAVLEQSLSGVAGQQPSVQMAVEILRQTRPVGAYNSQVVANSRVGGVVVLDPYSLSIWHSTGHAPTAAFSDVVQIGFDGPTGNQIDAVPLNPLTDQSYRSLAIAEQLYKSGRGQEALNALETMPVIAAIDRRRVGCFRGLVHAAMGHWQETAKACQLASMQTDDAQLAVLSNMLRAYSFQQLGEQDSAQRSWDMAERALDLGSVDSAWKSHLRQRNFPNLSSWPTMLAL